MIMVRLLGEPGGGLIDLNLGEIMLLESIFHWLYLWSRYEFYRSARAAAEEEVFELVDESEAKFFNWFWSPPSDKISDN